MGVFSVYIHISPRVRVHLRQPLAGGIQCLSASAVGRATPMSSDTQGRCGEELGADSGAGGNQLWGPLGVAAPGTLSRRDYSFLEG